MILFPLTLNRNLNRYFSMGAENFEVESKGKTPEEAFHAAKQEALYWHGHDGYTGTIAEKFEFKMYELGPEEDREDFIERMLGDETGPYYDKWGPAGCIKTDDEEYFFFGSASA